METQLEALLRGSLELAKLRKQLEEVKAENDKLKRAIGMQRLLKDLRSDFDQSCDDRPVSMFHRPQI